MFKNKMLAALAAFSLAGGALVGIASPALADDESTVNETPAAVEETVVTEAPVEETVVEAAPVETATEPVVTEPVVTEPVTEPVSTEPVVTEPVTPEPVTEESTTEESATEETSEAIPAEAEEPLVEESETTTTEDTPAPLLRIGTELAGEDLLVALAVATKVQFCHATGSEDNPYVFLETAVQAFFNAGHDTHQNFEDIVPPFSYQHQGQVIDFPGLNWDDEGQDLFYNGCNEVVVVPGLATASVFIAPATCTEGEQLVLGTVTNATWGEITDPPGDLDYSVTATADMGSLFEGDLEEVTFTGQLGPVDMSEECDDTLVKKVEFCHATGSENNPYVLIETSVNAFFQAGHDTHQNFEDIVPPFSYLKQGEVINFPGLNWDAAGQAFLENGCNPIEVLPTVSFTQFTCTADGSYTLGVAGGVDPAVVIFTVNGTANVPAGTHAASVGLTTVTVEAVAPHTLSPAWVNPATFQFVKPSASDCTTGGGGGGLAVTGASVGMTGTLAVAGGLLFLGLVAMFLRRRTTTG